MPKHFFFDLDNTLTPSKALILPEHVPVFKKLCEHADVIIVSGHGEKDIREHLRPETVGMYHVMGQNGNFAETRDGRELWNRHLPPALKDAAFAFIEKLRAYLHYTVSDENDIVEDRDSQISYSLIGHHENPAKKNAFDPKHEIRLGLLRTFSDDVKELRQDGVEVRSGGSTVLDFFAAGKNKGFNVAAYIDAMGWDKSGCIYIGDALFPGGNDESVIGVIPTHAVANPAETFELVAKMLS